MGGGGGAPPSPARRDPSGSRAPRTRRGRGYADDDDARDDDDRDDRGAYGDPPPGEDWASARDFRRGAGSVGARRGRGRDRADEKDASFARGDRRRGGSRSGAPSSSDAAPHHRTVWQERHDEKKRSRVAPTLAESLVGEALYGLNPARAALLAKRRAVRAIFVQEASAAASDPTLVQAAADLGVPLTPVSKHDLNMLVGSGRPHNGVALDVDPIAPTPISSLPTTWWEAESSDDANDDSAATKRTAPPPVWLALDEVVDPQNLGAVLRSAHFLGVDGVVSARRTPRRSPPSSRRRPRARRRRGRRTRRGAP
jgi:21S rRNA (GM2251-2'-O)-methyltransferase